MPQNCLNWSLLTLYPQIHHYLRMLDSMKDQVVPSLIAGMHSEIGCGWQCHLNDTPIDQQGNLGILQCTCISIRTEFLDEGNNAIFHFLWPFLHLQFDTIIVKFLERQCDTEYGIKKMAKQPDSTTIYIPHMSSHQHQYKSAYLHSPWPTQSIQHNECCTRHVRQPWQGWVWIDHWCQNQIGLVA